MRLLATLVFLIVANCAFAQSNVLPVDERGVHTFLEIMETNTAREHLSTNVKRFLKSDAKQLKLRDSKGDSVFLGTGKLVLSKTTGGIGHPVAEANCNFSIELKNNKCRMILTDYIVTPYERDRYANFVPTTVKYRLEDKPGKLNKGDWESNMKAIVVESSKLSTKLKAILKTNPSVADERKPAAVSTKNW